MAIADGVATADSVLGQVHPLDVRGAKLSTEERSVERAPADQDQVIGEFALASPDDAGDAVEAAHAAASRWARTPIEERTAILRRAADRLEEDRFRLTGVLIREVGKPALEALAEVEEAPVLIRTYCRYIEHADGFRVPMESGSPGETNISVLRPYGVWVVVSPFNFPLALAAGPASAALLTGNTVVLKPSPNGQLAAALLRDIFVEAGLPPDVFTLLPGDGAVGARLVGHRLTGGVTFTGSHAVGSGIMRDLVGSGKPVICEMGGKNPVVVSAAADIETAVEGVARAAFGYSGQKCSSCSRVYVQDTVHDEFCERLARRVAELEVGDPASASVFTGPVINEAAVRRFVAAVDATLDAGGHVLAGGEPIDGSQSKRGYFVAPTVVTAPLTASLWRDELFVPFVALAPFCSFDEAISLANATDYGLTAGVYSANPAEVEEFFERVEASVIYANRRAGATTGAWPGMQPISGWKASGSTGKGTGGHYYLPQYMREQSRTLHV